MESLKQGDRAGEEAEEMGSTVCKDKPTFIPELLKDEEVDGMESYEAQEYEDGFISEDVAILRPRRSSMSEDKIIAILDAYITEHSSYLKAKQDRQITEFHEIIGQSVGSNGNIISGLMKNLGREYRKMWNQNNGVMPDGGFRLRGSVRLLKKFEHYYKLYNKISLKASKSFLSRDSGVLSGPGNMSSGNDEGTPRIKKLKPSRQLAPGKLLEQVANEPAKIPPISVMSDRYCQEYIEVVREQNRVLTDIAKELRLMRMGYFTEHELSMDP